MSCSSSRLLPLLELMRGPYRAVRSNMRAIIPMWLFKLNFNQLIKIK